MFELGEILRVHRILSLEDVNSDFWDSSDDTFCYTKTLVYLGCTTATSKFTSTFAIVGSVFEHLLEQ